MSWVAKTTPSRIAELADELKYVREYISQLPTNVGTINIDSAGQGRRGATTNRIGPVKGIWSFNPAEVRRYHEEPILSFMGETPTPIFLNALELRAASQIVTPQTNEDVIPIRQLVTATNAGQILFLTVKNGKQLRLLTGSQTKNGVLDIKDVATDFVLDELVTGQTSGATCKVDFIQFSGQPGTLPAGERKLWFRELTGNFQSNEDISGDVAGSAKAKQPQFVDFSGNINIGENVDINQNVELLLKFNPNAPIPTSPEGSWIIIGGEVTTTVGAGGATEFPILFPTLENGDKDGTSTLAIDLAIATAHVNRIKLIEDTANPGVPITQLIDFINPPTVGESIVFYVTVEQDSNGGHTLDFTDTINNVPLIQTGPNKITNVGFITTDGGVTFDSFVFGQTLGDNLGNHEATEDLKMNTFNIIDVDVLRYADPGIPGQDGVIGFNVFGSSVEKDANSEFMKWSIPARESGIRRFYEWQVDLAPIMRLEHESNTGFSRLDMLNGTVQNTQGISFIHINQGSLSIIRPSGVELEYNNGLGSGQGGFHGFRVGQPVFPQFEVREFVNRSNVNLDMITNNIFEIDQAQFSNVGGFGNSTDHGIRTITGGNQGIVVNIPIGGFPSFNLFFENVGLTGSDLEYNFTKSTVFFNSNTITDILGLTFTNGTTFFDVGPNDFQVKAGLRTGPNPAPQTMKFIAQEQTGFETYINKDIFEITGQEDGPAGVGGGFKLFTDINMQTQNIHNIDVATWEPDVGLGIGGLANGAYGITADETGTQTSNKQFVFGIPLTSDRFSWQQGLVPAMNLEFSGAGGAPRLILEPSPLGDTSMEASQFLFTNTHSLGTIGMVDGIMRLVSAGGGLADIIVGTGGNLVNLSVLGAGGTSFIGFNADDDLRMNTFDINQVDVLRFQPDGGSFGAGNYAITASAADTDFLFNVPLNRNFTFENALEPIAVIDQTGMQLLANTEFFNPQLGAREFFLTGIHTNGTNSMFDGQFRLVDVLGQQDVIIGSGGNLINLSTLAAGASGYSFVQNEGNPVVQQNTLNFIGAGVTAIDDPANNRTNIDITAGSGAQQLDELSDVDITFPQDQDEGIFFSSITNTYTNRKIVNNMLDDGPGGLGTIFDRISGLAIQQQDLDMGGFSIINANVVGAGASRTLDNLLPTSVNESIIPNGTPNINLGSITFKWQDTFTNTLFVQDITTLAVGHIMDGNLIPTTGKTIGSFLGGEQYEEVHGRKYFTSPATVLDTGFTGMQQVGANLTLVSATNDIDFYGAGALRMKIDSSGNRTSFEFQNLDTINQITTRNMIIGFGGSGGSLVFNTNPVGFPVVPGELMFNGTDILAFTSNGTKNLKDIGTGAGGNFVTLDTTQTITGAKTWTAGQLFTSAVTMTSSVQLGDSASDLLISNGRWITSLVPNSTGQNLGLSSPRWGTIFVNTLDLQFGANVNNISTSSGASGNSLLMTASAIQTLVSTAGGGVTETQPFVNWTGTHVFNGTFMTIGNAASDVLQINSRVNSSIIPLNTGNNLGQASNRWDLFGQTMNLQLGSTVNNISTSSGASGNSVLMTATAIQAAIGAGGGGSFVTTNTSQSGLSGSKVWTGAHVFTNIVSFDSGVTLGNGSSDALIANGRWFTNLVPISSGLNLGASSQRWDIFAQQMSLQGGSTVSFISNNQSSNSTTSLMTSSAIQDAISAGAGGGSFVTLNTSQFISGTKTFTSSGSRFSSNLRIDGTLDHNGSRVGFRGRTPSSIQSIPFASSAGSTATQLASLRAQGNITRSVLINQGLATF